MNVFFLCLLGLSFVLNGQRIAGFSNAIRRTAVLSVSPKLSNFPLSATSSKSAALETRITEEPVVPTVVDLLKFGLPTLGIWLLQPILSLIDTSVIGMSASSASSVLELAALGPGIAWIDSSAYLCQFMGMATTNLYATAISEGDVNKQRKVLSHATIISIGLGLLLFAIQYTFAKPLVTILAGSAVESIPYALSYARIRSFASIIAVPTIVGQAAFLASKDSVTPLKAVLVGSVINIVGDLLLVCVLGKGIAGAAWATTLSQIGSALFLLAASVRRSMMATNKDLVVPSPSTLEKNAVHVEVIDSRIDLLPGINKVKEEIEEKVPSKQRMASLVQFPGFRDLTQYISFCGPLFFVLLMKAFSWSYTTYACSPAGPVSLAAHQIVLNMFCIFAIFGDAVSQISQTYLPQFFGTQVTTRKMYDNGESLISNIMKISVSMGLFNCIFAFLVVSKYAQKVRAISADFAIRWNSDSIRIVHSWLTCGFSVD
jgi:Na+-driven multidrug efflux pump